MHTPSLGGGLDHVLRSHELPVGIFESMVVYDLGCGYNDLASDLAARGVKATVTGFDENPDVLQEARQGKSATRLILAQLDDLPVPDASADIALATYSLPLWGKDPGEIVGFFQECTRVIRPDGILSICPIGRTAREDAHEIEQTMVACVNEVLKSPDWIFLDTKSEILTVIKK